MRLFFMQKHQLFLLLSDVLRLQGSAVLSQNDFTGALAEDAPLKADDDCLICYATSSSARTVVHIDVKRLTSTGAILRPLVTVHMQSVVHAAAVVAQLTQRLA